MRPIVKRIRLTAANTCIEFNPSRDAKQDLCTDLGTFCCFCEKYVNRSSLHVEHILGKKCTNAAGAKIYYHLRYRWDNFLLGCSNCNAVKGRKDVNVLNPFLPHQNNLVHFIEINNGGVVAIKNGVGGVDRQRTQAFIDLVGLDRAPGHPRYSMKDDRWENRLKVYHIAERQFIKYNQNPGGFDIETLVELAKTNGYFTIWYYQFFGVNNVISALINGFNNPGVLTLPFPGTHAGSFDALNNFITLPRP